MEATRVVSARPTEVVVAGHICLDIIPFLGDLAGTPAELFLPGKLLKVGPAAVATGGVVPNTGLALHRLGVATRLMGKVGDDLLGRAILDLLRRHDPELAEDMIVAGGEHTSYSVVINPRGLDRTFLHYPGTNDTFTADDVPYDRLPGTRILHFGYPPLMQGMYADGGQGLARMLRTVRGQMAAVSLDMSQPDLASDAGRVDWVSLLKLALPHVDFFLPSLDETLFMLDRPAFLQLESEAGATGLAALIDGQLLREFSGRLLEMGAAVVALKLGNQGLYLRTTTDGARLAAVGGGLNLSRSEWRGRELLTPCFVAEVAGTTGSGDCTIAGFLSGLLRGFGPEEAMRSAVAVGACSVEQPDANSGVPSWPVVEQRLAAGWPQRPCEMKLTGWNRTARCGLWRGPEDGR